MGKTKDRQKSALPELAFGASTAQEDLDLETMADRLSRGGSTLEYWSINHRTPFRSVSTSLHVGDLPMTANACTPIEFRATSAEISLLLVPLVGRGFATQDRRQVTWDADRTAAFMPQMDAVGSVGRRSAVGITMERERLEGLACRMLERDPGGAPILDFETPRALPLSVNGIRFDQVFRHLLAMIDGCAAVPAFLDRSGLDDSLRRLVVHLLKPEVFCGEIERPRERQNKLGNICDYIRANLDQKITLSVLEDISGLSPRVLQYAFRDRFGCSPMHWVANQRLDQVRTQILAAPPDTRVSEIAYRYFSNLGDFSRRYKAKFGELPSDTALQKRQGGPMMAAPVRLRGSHRSETPTGDDEIT